MKIKFTQPLNIQQGTSYMRLKEWQDRQDIKDFLQGNGTGNAKLDTGIKRYLIHLGVYDNNEQLSERGEELERTGKYPGLSEGKYSIWFAEDPILKGTRVFYYEREATRNDEHQSVQYAQNIKIDAIERAKTDQNEGLRVELENDRLTIIKQNNKYQEPIYMIYELEIDDIQEQASHYYLGTLSRGDKKTYKLQKPNQVFIKDKLQMWHNELLPTIGNELRGEWKQRYNHLFLSLEQAKQLGGDSALKRFILGNYKFTTKQGQMVEVEQMRLMPNSPNQAIKWFETLLTLEARKKYLQQSDLDSIAELKEEEAMIIYKEHLNTPRVQNLAKKYSKDRDSYWHLMAPQDLKPDNELQIAEPFCLQADNYYNMKEIVHSLGIKPNARWVAYYDKYVCRPHQQSYISILLNAIDADHSIVITNKGDMETIPSNKGTYLKVLSKTKDLQILDEQEVFAGRNVHDRYLILCDNRGELFLWSLTNSLSHFHKGDCKWSQVDTSTEIISLQDLTITPINTKMQIQLITYLKNHFHVK